MNAHGAALITATSSADLHLPPDIVPVGDRAELRFVDLLTVTIGRRYR